MKIKTVAIIGAGAIGSYFIAGLTEKLGDDLWIVAEGERKERLEKNGIVINDQKYDLHVKTPEEAKGVDLLIISVKYGALQGILPMIEKIVDAHTLVISPMNGVDSEKVIGEKIGMEHMLPSFMKIASRRIDNQIVYDPEVTMGLYFGEDNGEPSERTEAIEDLLKDTPIHHHLSANIQQDIWYKYALNISKNLPQAIINCGLGAYTDSEHMAYISARMRKEVSDVAAALGIDISDTSGSSGKECHFCTGQQIFHPAGSGCQSVPPRSTCSPGLWSAWAKNFMWILRSMNLPTMPSSAWKRRTAGRFGK